MRKGDLVQHVYNGKYGVVIALKPIDFSPNIDDYKHKIWNVLVWWAASKRLTNANWVPLPNLRVVDRTWEELQSKKKFKSLKS